MRLPKLRDVDPRWLVGIGAAATAIGLGYAAVRIARSATIVDATAWARPNSRAAPYVRERDPRSVNAAVLHQMGFSRGDDVLDYVGVTAHYLILPDGRIYRLYHDSVRLPASDGFNGTSVAIEFAGNMPSRALSNDPQHYWFPSGKHASPAYMDHLTPAQATSGRALLRYLRRHGVRYVFAHSQAVAGRGNDPGPEIWGAVAEYGIRELGMSDGGPSYYIDSGQPIRQSWRDAYALLRRGMPAVAPARLSSPGLGSASSPNDVQIDDEHGREPEMS